MKNTKKIILTLVILLLIAVPVTVLAEQSLTDEITKGVQDVGKGAGYKSTSESGTLPEVVGKIIKNFLIILGTLFTVLMIYGGYTWMTSFGSEQKVTKAKTLIVDAIIGLAIILSAYAITIFVVDSLVKATVK